MTEDTPKWFLLAVFPSHEKKVARLLEAKGVHVFLPLYRATRRWSDRAKQIDFPLFTCYLFARFRSAERTSVASTPGVRSILGDGTTFAAVSDDEIANLRLVVGSGYPMEPSAVQQAGQRVRVATEPEIQGTLVEAGDVCRIAVNVRALGQAVILKVPREALALIEAP